MGREQSPDFESFDDPELAAAYDAFDPGIRPRLLELRQLVYDAARWDPTIGPISESLKWGQPSYVPVAPRTGSPLRIGVFEGSPALFFHCQTGLVAKFRLRYTGTLRFHKNRAVLVEPTGRLPRKALMDCMATALTYHR